MVANELKVYKDTYDLVSATIELTKSFPKMYKYTIGQKINDVSLELFGSIQMANMYKDNRAKHLNEFLVNFELLKTLYRLSYDKKLISVKQFATVSSKCVLIGKQIVAWKGFSYENKRGA